MDEVLVGREGVIWLRSLEKTRRSSDRISSQPGLQDVLDRKLVVLAVAGELILVEVN